MGKPENREAGLYVHMYAHMPGWLGNNGKSWRQTRVTKEDFPHRFWNPRIPKDPWSPREGLHPEFHFLWAILLLLVFSPFIYSIWFHVWDMTMGGNSEPHAGVPVPPLRLPGWAGHLPVGQAFQQYCWVGSWLQIQTCPVYTLIKLSCLFVLRGKVHSAFIKAGTRRSSFWKLALICLHHGHSRTISTWACPYIFHLSTRCF